ncbi:hypothetical protein [Sphingopyxis sp.]|uniref:hypothetical protein n=1 Tax=Sphingopyxis sp. TaxID=1908224 RepID=UPI003D10CCC6
MSTLLVLAAMASQGATEAPISAETTARKFVAAVTRGIDPVGAGIVPSLTPEQSTQLKALQPCKFSLLGTSTKQRTRILWQCGAGRDEKAWMTQLSFTDASITSVEIEPLVKRPMAR